HGVIFNSDAKKLILITALRQTLGILSKDEIDPQVKTSEYGLLKAISPIDPIDLLSQELKVGGRDFIISDDKNNFIKNKIGIFMKSHALDHEYQLKFLSNLSEMISKTNGVRTVPNTRHAMIANAIYEMKSALQTPKTELEAKEALRVFSNEVKLG
ncbi:MAG: hypothetical protein KGQ36_07235, partial [Rickettsiales bacterium]|nr:hypothetical protein [Rickettsiales bacterium]